MKASVYKQQVREHWEAAVCGQETAPKADGRREYFRALDTYRYEHDHMIPAFARFESARGKRVLEVGLGSGSDFMNWVRAGAIAYGRDLTEASVAVVEERLELEGLDADVAVGDAELLDLATDSFDLYYSWGVLHHTPDTRAALIEAHRVLKPGGALKIMLYHHPSVGAVLVWFFFGILRLNFKSVRDVFAEHVESPGTQLFSKREVGRLVKEIFGDRPIEIRTHLWDLDLLTQPASTRYGSWAWRAARRIYPRWLVRRCIGDRFGTVMTIHTVK